MEHDDKFEITARLTTQKIYTAFTFNANDIRCMHPSRTKQNYRRKPTQTAIAVLLTFGPCAFTLPLDYRKPTHFNSRLPLTIQRGHPIILGMRWRARIGRDWASGHVPKPNCKSGLHNGTAKVDGYDGRRSKVRALIKSRGPGAEVDRLDSGS